MALTRVAILGSTGSIGRATLSVIARHTDRFRVVAVCAHSSVADVSAQVVEYGVPVAVIADPRSGAPVVVPSPPSAHAEGAALEVRDD